MKVEHYKTGLNRGQTLLFNSLEDMISEDNIVRLIDAKDFENLYKQRLGEPQFKKLIKERKSLIEHVFGTLEQWMGKIPILCRGKTKVQTEIDLYAITYNLRRLMNIETTNSLLKKINNYTFKNNKNAFTGPTFAAN